jgi:3-oxoacyl-[acyl-carrier-protein] synthase-3
MTVQAFQLIILLLSKNLNQLQVFQKGRYAKDEYTTSDLASFAAQKAIEDANIDKEELDYIIVAHNFGDVKQGTIQADTLPSIATRVKYKLEIENPNCVAYDILFGCPGWIEGVIQAQAFIKSGIAKKCLVIGAETLSRVIDEYDRDSMIYSDGAGACIVEATNGDESKIFKPTCNPTFAKEEAYIFYILDLLHKLKQRHSLY